jgi:N6-adenosine-specific RNA methylase IME4
MKRASIEVRHDEANRVLLADPPWKFNDGLGKRGAAANYPVLSVEEICAFPLPPMARDSYLFLWRVASMAEEAYQVVRARGFVPKAELVWYKQSKAPCRPCGGWGWRHSAYAIDVKSFCDDCSGRGQKYHFGLGHHVRASHECCIIATRGRPRPLVRNVRSVFEAPVGRHSAKPDRFYLLIERLAAGPYVELFARRERPGWTCYGNELAIAAPPTEKRAA